MIPLIFRIQNQRRSGCFFGSVNFESDLGSLRIRVLQFWSVMKSMKMSRFRLAFSSIFTIFFINILPFQRISNITAKYAKVTLVNDVSPNMLFFSELSYHYGFQNKRGKIYYDSRTHKLYSVWTGKLKTRRYRILFLIK